MKFAKRYGIIIVIVLPAAILSFVRLGGFYGFRYDAKKWSTPSFTSSNIAAEGDINGMDGSKLIIRLDTRVLGLVPDNRITVSDVQPEMILKAKNLSMIRQHKGPVILFAADDALLARIWMILCQKGCRNIYICPADPENERFKYEFRPDSSVKPEF